MIKRIYPYFTLFLIACTANPSDDCQNAVVYEEIKELSDYNSIFFDENYTGRVAIRSDSDSTIIEKYLFYKNGDLIKYESYYRNGNTKLAIPLKCNSKNGTVLYYYQNGQVAYEVPYALGKIDGIALSYYESGLIERVANYKMGKKDGPSFSINTNRDTVDFKMYEEGELIQ